MDTNICNKFLKISIKMAKIFLEGFLDFVKRSNVCMLSIQPNFTVNNHTKQTVFGNGRYNSGMFDDAEYVDFVEVDSSGESQHNDNFDIDYERAKAAQELDLWQETKNNVESLARTTESVPVLNKGMKIFSGLISVAVGWGGLRWGTVGTLKVLNDIGQSTAAKYVKNVGKDISGTASSIYNSAKSGLLKRDWVKSLIRAYNAKKQAAIASPNGQRLIAFKDSIKSNALYIKASKLKDSAVEYCKNLNPKRIFVETMGVAGGGTAAVNTIGGHAIDGNRHDIQQVDDDVFIVDGRYGLDYRDRGGYGNVA